VSKEDDLKNTKEKARAFEADEQYEEAEKEWRSILMHTPDDEEALSAMVALPDRIHSRDFMNAIISFPKKIQENDWKGAEKTFERIKAIARHDDQEVIAKAEDALIQLKKDLVSRAEKSFALGLAAKDFTICSDAITTLESLKQDVKSFKSSLSAAENEKKIPEEPLAPVETIPDPEPHKKKGKFITASVSVALIFILASVYLIYAWIYNIKVEKQTITLFESGKFLESAKILESRLPSPFEETLPNSFYRLAGLSANLLVLDQLSCEKIALIEELLVQSPMKEIIPRTYNSVKNEIKSRLKKTLPDSLIITQTMEIPLKEYHPVETCSINGKALIKKVGNIFDASKIDLVGEGEAAIALTDPFGFTISRRINILVQKKQSAPQILKSIIEETLLDGQTAKLVILAHEPFDELSDLVINGGVPKSTCIEDKQAFITIELDKAPLGCAEFELSWSVRIKNSDGLLSPKSEGGKKVLSSRYEDAKIAINSGDWRKSLTLLKEDFALAGGDPSIVASALRAMELGFKEANLKNIPAGGYTESDLDNNGLYKELEDIARTLPGEAASSLLTRIRNRVCDENLKRKTGLLISGAEKVLESGDWRRALLLLSSSSSSVDANDKITALKTEALTVGLAEARSVDWRNKENADLIKELAATYRFLKKNIASVPDLEGNDLLEEVDRDLKTIETEELILCLLTNSRGALEDGAWEVVVELIEVRNSAIRNEIRIRNILREAVAYGILQAEEILWQDELDENDLSEAKDIFNRLAVSTQKLPDAVGSQLFERVVKGLERIKLENKISLIITRTDKALKSREWKMAIAFLKADREITLSNPKTVNSWKLCIELGLNETDESGWRRGASFQSHLDAIVEYINLEKTAKLLPDNKGSDLIDRAVRSRIECENQKKNWSTPGFTYVRTDLYPSDEVNSKLKVYKHHKTELEFVLIPGGAYTMGSFQGIIFQLGREDGREECEGPDHKVLLRPFLLCRTECNQKAWDIIQGDDDRQWSDQKNPIENVSWDDCRAWCKSAGLRLPTEAEWEYACRGGTTQRFFFSNSPANLGAFAWYKHNGLDKSHNVGRKDINPFGLYDVYGNVAEWCLDNWHANYNNAPKDGSAWYEEGSNLRIVRGGGWNSDGLSLRSATRRHHAADVRKSSIGFRPAASLE